MQAASILIVDDDAEVRGVLQEALQAWGHHFVTALLRRLGIDFIVQSRLP